MGSHQAPAAWAGNPVPSVYRRQGTDDDVDSDSDFDDDYQGQPFPSFLMPHEVEEDRCPMCDSARSLGALTPSTVDLSPCSSLPPSSDVVFNSPGESFWR